MLTITQSLMIASMAMLIAGMINGQRQDTSFIRSLFISAPFYMVSFVALDNSPIRFSSGVNLDTILAFVIIIISAVIGETVVKKSNTVQ